MGGADPRAPVRFCRAGTFSLQAVASFLRSMMRPRRTAPMVRALLRYGTPLIAEVLVFWLILLAVNASDYGLDPPWPWRPWYPAASLLIVTFAMSAGEATFHLYRRLWSVASLNDAFAIGLAVVEASLLVTIVNLVFPDSYPPLRVLAPVLAAPAIVIAVRVVRLIPRFPRIAPSTRHPLPAPIPDASAYSTAKVPLH